MDQGENLCTFMCLNLLKRKKPTGGESEREKEIRGNISHIIQDDQRFLYLKKK